MTAKLQPRGWSRQGSAASGSVPGSHGLLNEYPAQRQGIVFYDVKFCEPELFDLPNLRQGLQDAGIPTATVEVDVGDPLSHQTLTRLEAFLEMIGHRR